MEAWKPGLAELVLPETPLAHHLSNANAAITENTPVSGIRAIIKHDFDDGWMDPKNKHFFSVHFVFLSSSELKDSGHLLVFQRCGLA